MHTNLLSHILPSIHILVIYLYSTFTFRFPTECPWGNNDNVIANNLDSFCREAITPTNCHDTCINPVTMVPKRVLGWKCCKTCVDVCGEAPSRDPNFEIRYPGVYSWFFKPNRAYSYAEIGTRYSVCISWFFHFYCVFLVVSVLKNIYYKWSQVHI